MAKKVWTLKLYLSEKYGYERTKMFHTIMNSEEKKKWKELMGKKRILTPKVIVFIHEVLGKPSDE